MIPNHENIIKITCKDCIIYFCKGHCSNEIFLKKINNQIEIDDSNITQSYGEIYIRPSKGMVFKVLNNESSKSFPITYIKTSKW